MRGDYEAKNDRHPFAVQYVGLDELCIRNLSTDEIVQRETKLTGDASKAQWDRLDAQAFALAKATREETLACGEYKLQGAQHETLAQTAERLQGAVH